jgi:hypothetical protein
MVLGLFENLTNLVLDPLVAIATKAPEEMLERDANGEVVESDVALVSDPIVTVEKSVLRSHASTPNISSALKKATISMKAQKSKKTQTT